MQPLSNIVILLFLCLSVCSFKLKYELVKDFEVLVCRGSKEDKSADLNNAGKILTKNEWNNNPLRKKFYQEKCGCPGITAYSDNKHLPFKSMQCCLRNNQNCKRQQHEGLYEIIKTVSHEVNKKECNNAPDWDSGYKERTKNGDGYIYRGQSSFFSLEGVKLEGEKLEEILKKGATWKYLAFTSFSCNKERAAGYSHYGESITGRTFLIRVKGSNNMKGLFIESCSLYPEEEEFLFNKNTCFRVESDVSEEDVSYVYENKSGSTKLSVLDLAYIECPDNPTYQS